MSAPLPITQCLTCGRRAWPARLLCATCGGAAFEQIPAGPGTVTERTQTLSPAGEPVAIGSVTLDATPVVVIARCDAAPAGTRVALSLGHDGAVTAEPIG
jgi:uncharacterized OB-fold protein